MKQENYVYNEQSCTINIFQLYDISENCVELSFKEDCDYYSGGRCPIGSKFLGEFECPHGLNIIYKEENIILDIDGEECGEFSMNNDSLKVEFECKSIADVRILRGKLDLHENTSHHGNYYMNDGVNPIFIPICITNNISNTYVVLYKAHLKIIDDLKCVLRPLVCVERKVGDRLGYIVK